MGRITAALALGLASYNFAGANQLSQDAETLRASIATKFETSIAAATLLEQAVYPNGEDVNDPDTVPREGPTAITHCQSLPNPFLLGSWPDAKYGQWVDKSKVCIWGQCNPLTKPSWDTGEPWCSTPWAKEALTPDCTDRSNPGAKFLQAAQYNDYYHFPSLTALGGSTYQHYASPWGTRIQWPASYVGIPDTMQALITKNLYGSGENLLKDIRMTDAREYTWYRTFSESIRPNNEVVYGSSYMDSDVGPNGPMMITASKAVYRNGEFLGAVAYDHSATLYTDTLKAFSDANPNKYAFLVSGYELEKGHLLYHPEVVRPGNNPQWLFREDNKFQEFEVKKEIQAPVMSILGELEGTVSGTYYRYGPKEAWFPDQETREFSCTNMKTARYTLCVVETSKKSYMVGTILNWLKHVVIAAVTYSLYFVVFKL